MTYTVFHIGNTPVTITAFKSSLTTSSIKVTMFQKDSFSDPNFILEGIMKKCFKTDLTDGKEPNLELGGTP